MHIIDWWQKSDVVGRMARMTGIQQNKTTTRHVFFLILPCNTYIQTGNPQNDLVVKQGWHDIACQEDTPSVANYTFLNFHSFKNAGEDAHVCLLDHIVDLYVFHNKAFAEVLWYMCGKAIHEIHKHMIYVCLYLLSPIKCLIKKDFSNPFVRNHH